MALCQNRALAEGKHCDLDGLVGKSLVFQERVGIIRAKKN